MRKVVLTGLVVLGMVFGARIAQATDVSGDVSGAWIIGGSPYIVTANAAFTFPAHIPIKPIPKTQTLHPCFPKISFNFLIFKPPSLIVYSS